MVKLFDANKINLLRDLRQQQSLNWLLPEEYLAFLKFYPQLEKRIKNAAPLLASYGLTPEKFLESLSKKRPATNFNPQNKLGKKRHKWSKSQIDRLKRLK